MTDLEQFALNSPFLTGLLASVLAGAVATSAGALPVVFVRQLSDHTINVLLSFAAGIMLAATMFSLLLPGYEAARSAGSSASAAALAVLAAMAAGGLALWFAHRYAPHEHFAKGSEGADA